MLDFQLSKLTSDIIREMERVRVPVKARAIAAALKEDVSAVNHCLYNELSSYVIRDDYYRWRLIGTNLPRTRSGIFYIHEYIPYRWWSWRTEEQLIPTKTVLAYKKGDSGAIEELTDELESVIDGIILQQARWPFVYVAAVPVSKVGGFSPVQVSINRICSRHRIPGHVLWDSGGLLERVSDVDSSHSRKGTRPTYYEHIVSIDHTGWSLSPPDNSCCLLIDDITTTGLIMDVCQDILDYAGMPKENIIRLAIAKTSL